MPVTAAHPLDQPIWHALTTRQYEIAEGTSHARRYPVAIAPFAATPEPSPACYEALRSLMAPPDRVALFTLAPVMPGPGLITTFAKTAEQMIWEQTVFPPTPEVVALGEHDVDAMMGLVELTKPGPFGPRTHELGNFFGIRLNGKLVAMAGERMKLDGYTEITAVCAHPSARGRGYAEMVIAAVARGIVARGEQPFLHVFSDNAPALKLYHRLGFFIRRRFHATVLTPTP